MKTKYISYSLWGDNPLYTTGMIRNMEQAAVLYPDWQIVVYFDDTVPPEIINIIKEKGAITINRTGNIYGMFWRFYAADLDGCTHVIFRDSDSRLTLREKLAVDEWIKNDDTIHIMRDHPYHLDPVGGIKHYILGGMWGIKGNAVNMQQLIAQYCKEKALGYGSDQIFLNNIYQEFKTSATIHDEFFSDFRFPIKRTGYHFIGERIDEEEKPVGDDWRAIKNLYSSKKPLHIVCRKIKQIIRRILP